jgi:hypothetical protein
MRTNKRRIGGAVSLIFLAGAAAPAGAAIIAGQADDFEDGTIQDWFAGGASNPNGPSNVATGGPAGAGDNYMLLRANGAGSAGGKLVVLNAAQWGGDYLAGVGVSAIDMHVNNLGATSLTLRLILNDISSGQSLVTVADVPVPAGSGWQPVSFSLTDANLTGGDFATVMGSVAELSLVHSPVPIVARSLAPNVVAQLGVDNIAAVPEPAGLLVPAAAAAALARRRRRLCRVSSVRPW